MPVKIWVVRQNRPKYTKQKRKAIRKPSGHGENGGSVIAPLIVCGLHGSTAIWKDCSTGEDGSCMLPAGVDVGELRGGMLAENEDDLASETDIDETKVEKGSSPYWGRNF